MLSETGLRLFEVHLEVTDAENRHWSPIGRWLSMGVNTKCHCCCWHTDSAGSRIIRDSGFSNTASSTVILLGAMVEEYSFTPVKSAQRSLADDEGFWVSPGAQQLEQKERNAVLATAAIKEDLQEDKLKQLVEAARE